MKGWPCLRVAPFRNHIGFAHKSPVPHDTSAFIWPGNIEISGCLICHTAVVGVVWRATCARCFLLLESDQITMPSCYRYQWFSAEASNKSRHGSGRLLRGSDSHRRIYSEENGRRIYAVFFSVRLMAWPHSTQWIFLWIIIHITFRSMRFLHMETARWYMLGGYCIDSCTLVCMRAWVSMCAWVVCLG